MKHPVDVYVGKRIRHRRWMVGMTQQQLAEKVGIKFQQIQKYETGMNRVSASRLWEISQAVNVPIAYFFEGFGTEAQDGVNGNATGPVDATANGEANGHALGQSTGKIAGDLVSDKEAMDLIRSYYSIPESQRRQVFELARVLGTDL